MQRSSKMVRSQKQFSILNSQFSAVNRRRLTFESLENREMLTAVFPGSSLENTPNDPKITEQWGLNTVNAAEAWKFSDGTGVVVAVLDSGTALTHPDLQANLWKNPGETADDGIDNDGNGLIDDIYGWNFIDNNNDVSDSDGHGTHVAGIIGATANNGKGGCGVAPGVQLLTVKVISGSTGSTSCIVAGLNYVTGLKRSGVNVAVVNMSVGYYNEDIAVAQAVQDAGAAGIVVVCSAGNNSNNNDAKAHYPSQYSTFDNVIAVASVDKQGSLASNSNYGFNSVNLAAPGVSVFSTLKDGSYGNMSGTSMAAPFVSGAAAILAANNPALSAKEIKTAILGAARRSAALSSKTGSGGILNIGAVFTPPVLPENTLTASAESGSSVRLSWDAVDNAKKYIIERSNNAVQWTTAATVSHSTEISVKGLKPGTNYFFRLKVLTPEGTGEPSEPVEVQTLLQSVDAPRLSIMNNAVRLRWTAVTGAAGYRIERSAGDSGEWSTLTDLTDGTTEFFDAIEEYHTELFYRITALSGGETPDAVPSKAKSVLTPPEPPENVEIAGQSDTQITLSWQESPGAVRYQIERFVNGRWSVAGSTKATEITLRKLKPETEYEFRIVAVGKTGKSFAKTSVFAATTVAVPSAPPHLKVKAMDSDTVLLMWEPAKRAESYLIRRYTYDDKQWEDAGTTEDLFYIDSALSESTRYAYEVIAVNAGGTSKKAAKGQATTFRQSDGAEEPENLTLIKATQRTLKLSWEREGNKPLSYRIQWAAQQAEETAEDIFWTEQKKIVLQPLLGKSTAAITGLQPGTLYYVRIRIEAPGLVSEWSSIGEFTTTGI